MFDPLGGDPWNEISNISCSWVSKFSWTMRISCWSKVHACSSHLGGHTSFRSKIVVISSFLKKPQANSASPRCSPKSCWTCPENSTEHRWSTSDSHQNPHIISAYHLAATCDQESTAHQLVPGATNSWDHQWDSSSLRLEPPPFRDWRLGHLGDVETWRQKKTVTHRC